MNKFTKKIVGKYKIFLPLAIVVLVVGILLAAIFGMNVAPTSNSEKTLKIHVGSFYSEERVEAIENVCGKVFAEKSVDECYHRVERVSINDYSVVYSFKSTFEDAKIEELRDAVAAKLTGTDGVLGGIDNDLVIVSYASATPHTTYSKGFVARAAIAGGVLLLAAFVYTAIRHKLAGGIIVASITVASVALTFALTAIVRIPVSSTFANALFLTAVVGAVFSVSVAGKMRKAETDVENEGLDAADVIAKSMPEKQLAIASGTLILGTLLIGALGISPVQWLSTVVLFGILSAYYVAAVLFPAVYPAIFARMQKNRAAKRRYDYKKSKAAKEGKDNSKKAELKDLTDTADGENTNDKNEADETAN